MTHLILIPAMGCSARLYFEILPVLMQHVQFNVHLPTADRFETMVEDVLVTAPDTFAVLGTSMGGRLALELALAAPERVTGLVMIGSTAGRSVDPKAGTRRSERMRHGEFDTVINEMAEMISHKPGPRGESAKDIFRQMMRGTGLINCVAHSDALAHREDRWGELRNIRCPTLCLWGSHDQFSPPDEGKRIANSVRGGQYVQMPNCGHLPTLEYPEETADILAKWLKQSRLA